MNIAEINDEHESVMNGCWQFTVYGKKMKRNGPFTIRSSSVRGPCVFAVHFESVLIKYYYIRTALSALARGSL